MCSYHVYWYLEWTNGMNVCVIWMNSWISVIISRKISVTIIQIYIQMVHYYNYILLSRFQIKCESMIAPCRGRQGGGQKFLLSFGMQDPSTEIRIHSKYELVSFTGFWARGGVILGGSYSRFLAISTVIYDIMMDNLGPLPWDDGEISASALLHGWSSRLGACPKGTPCSSSHCTGFYRPRKNVYFAY